MIIFLNGASSTGKTSLAEALQKIWPEPLVYWSLDNMITQLPVAYWGYGEHAGDYFQLVDHADYTEAVVGPRGHLMTEISADFVASHVAAGFHVVLDYVVLDEESLMAFVRRLLDVPALFVGVYCEESALIARNAERADRAPNLSLHQQRTVHFCADSYDMVVDTATHSAEMLAQKILDFVKNNPLVNGIDYPAV